MNTNYFPKKWLLVFSSLMIPGLILAGCTPSGSQSQNGPCDHLIGWYELPNHPGNNQEIIPGSRTLIPVFKIDGTYYSVCRGIETPLKECPEGLEWALAPSSMVGTQIGFNKASNTYYLIIKDQMRSSLEEETAESIRKKGFRLGEKEKLIRIDKPSWLLDTTAQPPRTNEDFLGWYQPVWFPYIRYEIQKNGERFLFAGQMLDEPGIWKSADKPQELTPLPEGLGFTGSPEQKNVNNIVYNEALKRFELTMMDNKRQPSIIRMPLAQIPSPVSNQVDAVTPHIKIGIPSWH